MGGGPRINNQPDTDCHRAQAKRGHDDQANEQPPRKGGIGLSQGEIEDDRHDETDAGQEGRDQCGKDAQKYIHATDAGDESDEESDEESDVASDAADERADEEPYEEADQEADQEAGEEADEEASTEVDICDCPNCRRSAAAETAEPCQPGFSITITVKFN